MPPSLNMPKPVPIHLPSIVLWPNIEDYDHETKILAVQMVHVSNRSQGQTIQRR